MLAIQLAALARSVIDMTISGTLLLMDITLGVALSVLDGKLPRAMIPPNHGLMSAVYVCSLLEIPATILSNVSSSFASIVDWSLKPGNADRNSATFWRWSPGRSRRYSPYWTTL